MKSPIRRSRWPGTLKAHLSGLRRPRAKHRGVIHPIDWRVIKPAVNWVKVDEAEKAKGK